MQKECARGCWFHMRPGVVMLVWEAREERREARGESDVEWSAECVCVELKMGFSLFIREECNINGNVGARFSPRSRSAKIERFTFGEPEVRATQTLASI